MEYVAYKVPADVDALIYRHQVRIAKQRGVKLSKVTKAGDVLREWARLAEVAAIAAEQQPDQAQP